MCELMTIVAALVFTALWFAARRAGRPANAKGTAALMFWGAALILQHQFLDLYQKLVELHGSLRFLCHLLCCLKC